MAEAQHERRAGNSSSHHQEVASGLRCWFCGSFKVKLDAATAWGSGDELVELLVDEVIEARDGGIDVNIEVVFVET